LKKKQIAQLNKRIEEIKKIARKDNKNKTEKTIRIPGIVEKRKNKK
jgi:hypothetical protein